MTFEQELIDLLDKYNFNLTCNASAELLSNYILDCLKTIENVSKRIKRCLV